MTRDQARQDIRSRWRELYAPDSKKGIICPLCGSGSGPNGTGITENPRKPGQLKCWSCDFTGDVLDLIQAEHQTDYNGALKAAAAELGLEIESGHEIDLPGGPRSAFSPAPHIETPQEPKSPQRATSGPTEQAEDNTAYYVECMGRINDPAAASYLQARGISAETAAMYGIGFDPAADPARAGHPAPRIIIPVNREHYIARSIDPSTPPKFQKLNNKGAAIGIFDQAALHRSGADTVFVTEGAFDALAIIEAGGQAIALNSTSNARELIKHLERERTEATLILCLDKDQAGSKATEELRAGLTRLNISYITADVSGSHKDPNEALTADRAAFIEAVKKAEAQTAARPDNIRDYITLHMAEEIKLFRESRDRKTGFDNLDAKAGGLYAGLYVIAAISSLGKTTFAHQMADQLAAAGDDVLFFSLEQSRLELVSKSIARITGQRDINKAVTSLEIRRGYNPQHVKEATEEYLETVADRLSIIEGNFNCTVAYIGEYTRRYIQRTGRRPVIFVDYLQILQGDPDKRQSTKEMIDSTVTELKRLSRAENLTVFIISSVNRANYLAPIDFESLKESGAIEYSADVIWGLQLQCLNDPLFDKNEKIKEKRARVAEAKAADPREIELVCLKNRYGISRFSVRFDYYPKYDFFVPMGDMDFETVEEAEEETEERL